MSLNCLVASPPFMGSINDGLKESDRQKYKEFKRAGQGVGTGYGQTPGQLAALREGTPTTGATKLKRIKHYDWTGLYDQSWKGVIVPGAFVHPAKYSRALIRRIYEFMFEQKWLREGDTVLDPFGGVALGALDAMTMGLNFVGLELEPRFVALGQENIALWEKRYKGRLPRWGTAQIIQGDSRHLLDVIAGAGAIATSPPYAESRLQQVGGYDGASMRQNHRRGIRYGGSPGQLAALREGDVQSVIASPPYSAARVGDECGQEHVGHNGNYGHEAGQLGSMKEGIVSSPPYAQTLNPESVDPVKRREREERYRAAHPEIKRPDFGDYGETDGQLANMAEGVVSSPPYEGSINTPDDTVKRARRMLAKGITKAGHTRVHNEGLDNMTPGTIGGLNTTYGKGDGQLGNEQGETFWSAARIIVAQAYAALAPGAHAAWVLKSFVRNKAIVDFPQQWQTLCESVGFETVAIARAWQTKDDGTQLGIDGNHKRLYKKKVGFFRRLHEKRYPETKIDYEIVLFQVKR